MGESSNTYCPLPWTHLATSTDGSARLCCLAREFSQTRLGTLSITDAWNSLEFQDARDKMSKGQKIAACETCYKEEAAGKQSHREKCVSHLSSTQRVMLTRQVEKKRLTHLDLRLGNTCNLQCVMCRPQESSRWYSLAQKLAKRTSDPEMREIFRNNVLSSLETQTWHRGEWLISEIKPLLPGLRELILGGGEPMLSDEHVEILLECVRSGHSSHISVRYHTNGTLLDERLPEFWRHFEKVDVYVSLDGVGERNRYIRYPADFDVIERHLHRLDELGGPVKMRILCSVQALNMMYLPEFVEGIQRHNFKHAYNIVHDPAFLSTQIYPAKLKKFLSENLPTTPQVQELLSHMNQRDESARLPQFREYIRLLDQERGTDFERTFPELAEWLTGS